MGLQSRAPSNRCGVIKFPGRWSLSPFDSEQNTCFLTIKQSFVVAKLPFSKSWTTTRRYFFKSPHGLLVAPETPQASVTDERLGVARIFLVLYGTFALWKQASSKPQAFKTRYWQPSSEKWFHLDMYKANEHKLVPLWCVFLNNDCMFSLSLGNIKLSCNAWFISEGPQMVGTRKTGTKS